MSPLLNPAHPVSPLHPGRAVVSQSGQHGSGEEDRPPASSAEIGLFFAFLVACIVMFSLFIKVAYDSEK